MTFPGTYHLIVRKSLTQMGADELQADGGGAHR